MKFRLKILSGPLIGKTFPLNSESITVGRSDHCNITLPFPDVSKTHVRISTQGNSITLTDMNSSNGTFVNSIKIQSQQIPKGTIFSLHNYLMLIEQDIDKQTIPINHGNTAFKISETLPPPQDIPTGSTVSLAQDDDSSQEQDFPSTGAKSSLVRRAENYFENVIMAGFYKLFEVFDSTWVIGTLLGLYAGLVITLSYIPTSRTLSEKLQQESKMRATSIAQTLASKNKPYLNNNETTLLSTQSAMTEPGVEMALILSHSDGSVLAPTNLSSKYLDIPFIHKARKNAQVTAVTMGDGKIGVNIPILGINKFTNEHGIIAHAIVIYNGSFSSWKNKNTVGLYIQIITLALLLLFPVIFLMSKVFNHPMKILNRNLNEYLMHDVYKNTTNLQNEEFRRLNENISSSINRSSLQSTEQQTTLSFQECNNLVHTIPFSAALLNENIISTANTDFSNQFNIYPEEFSQHTLQELNDQSLILSIEDLIQRVKENPFENQVNTLELSNTKHNVMAQRITIGSTPLVLLTLFGHHEEEISS